MRKYAMRNGSVSLAIKFFFLGLVLVVSSSLAFAKSAREIDISVDVALEEFVQDVRGAKEFLKGAKGGACFPQCY